MPFMSALPWKIKIFSTTLIQRYKKMSTEISVLDWNLCPFHIFLRYFWFLFRFGRENCEKQTSSCNNNKNFLSISSQFSNVRTPYRKYTQTPLFFFFGSPLSAILIQVFFVIVKLVSLVNSFNLNAFGATWNMIIDEGYI